MIDQFLLFMTLVVVVVVETVSARVTSVTCDFSDNQHYCGYSVGQCWDQTDLFSPDSGNTRSYSVNFILLATAYPTFTKSDNVPDI